MSQISEIKRIDKLVAERIYSFRKKRKMPRAELSKKLNVTDAQITKYEQGINRITIGKLVIIAKIFNIPVSEFYK